MLKHVTFVKSKSSWVGKVVIRVCRGIVSRLFFLPWTAQEKAVRQEGVQERPERFRAPDSDGNSAVQGASSPSSLLPSPSEEGGRLRLPGGSWEQADVSVSQRQQG